MCNVEHNIYLQFKICLLHMRETPHVCEKWERSKYIQQEG